MSCVTYHLSHVTFHLSHVKKKIKKIFDKVVELVGGGSVINGPTQSSFMSDSILWKSAVVNWQHCVYPFFLRLETWTWKLVHLSVGFPPFSEMSPPVSNSLRKQECFLLSLIFLAPSKLSQILEEFSKYIVCVLASCLSNLPFHLQQSSINEGASNVVLLCSSHFR